MKDCRIPALLIALCLMLCVCSGCGDKDKTAAAADIRSVTLGEISQYRPTFTVDRPPTYNVLNSITNNSVIGDERQFVRIYDANGTEYIDEIELQPYQIYEVRMYFINDNSMANGSVENTFGHVDLPETVSESGSITGTITCDAAYPTPEKITDSITITTQESLTLTYITDSAWQYVANYNGKCSDQPIEDDILLFTGKSKIGYGDKTTGKWLIHQAAKEPQYVTFAFFTEPADGATTANP